MVNRISHPIGGLVFAAWVLFSSTAMADERADAVEKLIEQLQSPRWQVRMSAAVGLGGAGKDARHALPELWKARSDPHEKVRQWAEKSLEKIYQSLHTEVPLDELVQQIADEPPPPKWNRIAPAGSANERELAEAGVSFADSREAGEESLSQPSRWPGWLVIRIPLPYPDKTQGRNAHARLVGKAVSVEHGGLRVELTQGYVPKLWEEREIIATRALHGKFAKVDLPKLPAGRKWILIYDDLENGFDLDRDGRADVTLRVAPSDFDSEDDQPVTPSP